MSLSPASAGVADLGAGVPPGASPTPLETPQSTPDKPASGEGLAPQGAQPSPGSGTPGDVADKLPPFHEHPRWKEVTGELGRAKQELESLKPQWERTQPFVETLERHGIYEPQQVDSLVEAVQTYQSFERLIDEDPIGFATRMREARPESFQTMAAAIVTSTLLQHADALRGTNAELASQLEQLAGQYQGNGKGRSPRGNPTLDRERQEVERGKAELLSTRRAEFEDKVNTGVGDAITREIDRLAGGVKFPNDAAKSNFYELVTHKLDQIVDGDGKFQAEIARMMGPEGGYKQPHLDAVVRRHINRALQGGQLEKLISETLTAWSLTLQRGEEQRQHQNAQQAADGGTGAAPAGGKLQGAALDNHLGKLRKSGASFQDRVRAIVSGP